MKKRELSVYRKKKIEDLKKILGEKKKESQESYSKIRTGTEKNVRTNKNLRKEIAQILTIIREKEIINDPNLLLKEEGSAKETGEKEDKK